MQLGGHILLGCSSCEAFGCSCEALYCLDAVGRPCATYNYLSPCALVCCSSRAVNY